MWEDNIFGTYDTQAGPQTDGTVVYPVQTPQPADTGGGMPGQYGAAILDVFKYGVGVWQENRRMDSMLDYRRFEATQNGLAQQGQAAAQIAAAQQSGTSTLLLIGAAVVVVLLLSKG